MDKDFEELEDFEEYDSLELDDDLEASETGDEKYEHKHLVVEAGQKSMRIDKYLAQSHTIGCRGWLCVCERQAGAQQLQD